MNTDMTWQITSPNSDFTETLAEKLGKALKGGEVIELVSDLGGGKTTFVRGLARGMGSEDRVASPTFTISRVYTTPHLTMHHFDFYRLGEAGLIVEELAEVLDDSRAVIVVEWAGIVQEVLPARRMTITMQKTPEDTRILQFAVPPELDYLLAAVKENA
jgi:tRNA threonylcarbamoyladenosine biosynthesis protein TsaE